MLPFLTSRVMITGSGGLGPRSAPGIRWMWSPRADFVSCARSRHTEGLGRGIWDELNINDARFTGRNSRRLHVHVGDGARHPASRFLRFGVTGAVVAALAAGARVPDSVLMTDEQALAALRTFASDRGCAEEVAVRCGGRLSAVAIQRAYLEMVEGMVEHLEWIETVCKLWHRILDDLESGSREWLERVFDGHIKRRLFDQVIRGAGFEWDCIERLNPFVQELHMCLSNEMERRGRQKLSELPPSALLSGIRHSRLGGKEEVERLEAFEGLLDRLQATDMLYMKLGPESLFERLVATGQIEPSGISGLELEGPADPFALAPPSRGRARTRGRLVAEFGLRQTSEAKCRCSWHRFTSAGRDKIVIEMPDPAYEGRLPMRNSQPAAPHAG